MTLPSTISLDDRRTILAKAIRDHRRWMRSHCDCARCRSDLRKLRLQACRLRIERMTRQFRMNVRGVVVL